MRRILLALALVCGLLAAATPAAATATADVKAAQARFVAATTAHMEAQGWETLAAGTTSARLGVTIYHVDGLWSGRLGWYNKANGRYYYMYGIAAMQHEEATTPDTWRGYIDVWCERHYGTTAVTIPCNWYVDDFTAIGFAQGTGGGWHVWGTKNTANTNCNWNSGGDTSAWRNLDATYQWNLVFMGYIRAHFLTSACQFVHETGVYALGSKRVNMFTHGTATDPANTGWL
jgi:hypothetical protein